MDGFGKYYSLRMGGCSGVELLGELGLLSQQHTQRVFVLLPVGDGLTGNTTIDGCTGHSGRHLRDESRIDGFGNEIVAAEVQVVYLVDIIHHIGNRLLGQVGNGMDGSKLHLLVDGSGMNVEGTTEDIGKAYHIINLVWIVSAAC